MKRINIIFALLAFSLITCDDDFLNEPPLDRITSPNFAPNGPNYTHFKDEHEIQGGRHYQSF